MLKTSDINECAACVKILKSSNYEMKCIWYLPKKSKFPFYFILLIGYNAMSNSAEKGGAKMKNKH